ncbi:hypothetical protein ACKKBG_A24320 [Auxenochlorella protothecoides x Auxenochlorella symbiontica]
MSFEVDLITALPTMDPGVWHCGELCSGLSSPSSAVQRSEYSFDSLGTPSLQAEMHCVEPCAPALNMLLIHDHSGPHSGKEEEEANPNAKRAKVEWTRELHMVFAGVVRSLPVDQQVPTKILEGMGQWGWGLTRANIASHLQKFRHRERECGALVSSCSTPHLDAEGWAYHDAASAGTSPYMMMPTTPPSMAPSLAFQSEGSLTDMEWELGQTGDVCPPSLSRQLAQCVQERPAALPIGLTLDHGAVLRALRRRGSLVA